MEEQFPQLDYDQRIALTCEIILDVLIAIRHLNYTKDCAHRDIKPENIALCQKKWCILDFECAAEVGQKVKGTVGSPYYMHPWCFVDCTKSTFPGNDMYAVALIMRQLLGLPSMFTSKSYYDLIDEKISIHRAEISAKWQNHEFPKFTDDSTGFGKLTRLTEQMSGLMSDQPSIDDVIDTLKSVHEKTCKNLSPTNRDSATSRDCTMGFINVVQLLDVPNAGKLDTSSSLFNDLYESSRSDGYFSSSRDKAEAYMQEVPKVLEFKMTTKALDDTSICCHYE